jgi:DNA mismatch endonuclease (patch repair protein)
MAAIRSTNTGPERALRAALRERGATGYRIHLRSLPGRPDVAFTRWKVAVFVDGAFWHGHPDHFNPATATEYWRDKIKRTQERDRQADEALGAPGRTAGARTIFGRRFWWSPPMLPGCPDRQVVPRSSR